MTKSPARESPPEPNEQSQPLERNIYDYDGEYEFPIAQHRTPHQRTAPIEVREVCYLVSRSVRAATQDRDAACGGRMSNSLRSNRTAQHRLCS